MPYHTQTAMSKASAFDQVIMAVDNLKQNMEDENWVNMNEGAEDWLMDNANEHGYVEMDDSGTAQSWLYDNAEDHGYYHEDEDSVREDDLKDEIEKLKAENHRIKKVARSYCDVIDFGDEGAPLEEIEKLKKERDEALEMQEQYSQDADRATEAEAQVEELQDQVASMHETQKAAWTSVEELKTELVRMREHKDKEIQNYRTNEEVREILIAELKMAQLKMAPEQEPLVPDINGHEFGNGFYESEDE
jgi:hypothetical protein